MTTRFPLHPPRIHAEQARVKIKPGAEVMPLERRRISERWQEGCDLPGYHRDVVFTARLYDTYNDVRHRRSPHDPTLILTAPGFGAGPDRPMFQGEADKDFGIGPLLVRLGDIVRVPDNTPDLDPNAPVPPVHQHFNQLTPQEAERLAYLTDQLGAALVAIGKIQRHGYESRGLDPNATGPTNRETLVKELGGVAAALELISDHDTGSKEFLQPWVIQKRLVDSSQYFHHQLPIEPST